MYLISAVFQFALTCVFWFHNKKLDHQEKWLASLLGSGPKLVFEIFGIVRPNHINLNDMFLYNLGVHEQLARIYKLLRFLKSRGACTCNTPKPLSSTLFAIFFELYNNNNNSLGHNCNIWFLEWIWNHDEDKIKRKSLLRQLDLS